ncbi:MAG: hypothetical protein DHS20C15_13220 [Planctomycetota bacterium]|nr:MAG: hypothetical protein DHS20C15_13220 [Planctomycetota bacterium]
MPIPDPHAATRECLGRPVEGEPGAPPLFVDEPFPPYRFVPGKTPHPFAHAEGYGHGAPRPVPVFLPEDRWRENRAYLRGVDFFNRGWWWEAHEAWEELWHVVEGKDDRQHTLLKALIQLAACALNRERGVGGGAARLLASATAALDGLAPATQLLGVDLVAMRGSAQALLVANVPQVNGFYVPLLEARAD